MRTVSDSNEDGVMEFVRKAEKAFNSHERRNVETLWAELSEFILNNQSGLFSVDHDSIGGSKKTQRIYDSTAIQANRDLAASIHSTLTNPSTRWAKLRFKDEALNNNSQTVAWLEAANQMLYDELNTSNFANEVASAYQFYTALGSMALWQEDLSLGKEPGFNGFHFNAIHLAEIAWAENATGVVDTIYRRYKMTAKQAFERWGEEAGERVMECMKEDPLKRLKFMHIVFPRPDKEIGEGDLLKPEERPYASLHINMEEHRVVEKGGYYELPCHVSRFEKTPGEAYGRGPGHIALPDVKSLNEARKMALQAIAKAINPPIFASQTDVIGTIDLRPGSLNIMRSADSIKEFQTAANFDVTQVAVQDLKESIRSMFFIDKFLLPPRTETGEMSAFEVAQRIEQMQRALGPTLGRLNTELLNPLVVRSFKMLMRGNVLPPMPEDLQIDEAAIEIEYTNQLARSQRFEEVNAIQQWAGSLVQLAQAKPEVLDYINGDAIAKHTAKIQGVPEIAVTNDKEVQAARQQRAQQAQQAQAVESANKMADAQSKLQRGQQGGQ